MPANASAPGTNPPWASQRLSRSSARLLSVTLLALDFLSSGAGRLPAVEPPPERAVGLGLLQQHVREILTHHCLKCHGGESVEAEFSLLDESRLAKGGVSGPAIDSKSPRDSRIYQRITHAVKPGMPFQADRLPDDQVALILRWIEAGAPYDKPLADTTAAAPASWIAKQVPPSAREFWAFQPLKRVVPPEVRDPLWSRNPIDRFIFQKLEAAGLTPNPPVDPPGRLRRAAFELTGLPPTPEELDRAAEDQHPKAWSNQIDRLLDSPHFGERWARHWLDVARFAESHGYEHDYDRPTAYTYRDFVIEAFNRDLPFDQFVKWQIAGDEFAPDDRLALQATGFLAAGVHSTQITKNEVEKHRYDELDDIVNTIGLSMLGLSVGCARCHDHKYDPIPQRDYYQLVSTFTSTVRSEVEVEVETEQTALARARHAAEHAPLVEALRKYETAELAPRFAAWERDNPLPAAEFPWLIVEPAESKSEGGASLTLQPDGAVVASGANPQFDVYTFVVRTPLTGIRHLRIEALALPGLVRGGPGRADNGNFDLTDLKVTIAPLDQPESAQPLRLLAPRATFEQPGLPIAAALDGDDRSGWAVDPQFGKDHACGFTLAEPAGFQQGSILTFRLVFKGNDRHNFGRTRLALSAAEKPPELNAEAFSSEILSALSRPAAERTDAQRARLQAWYGSRHDARWQQLNQAVLDHAGATSQPLRQKSLISSEGLPALRLHSQGGDFLEHTHFLRRGDPNQKVAIAAPGFLQVLTPAEADPQRWREQPPAGWRTSYRRRTLANWITDVDHGAGALLARVIVNRLWQHHFGRGLVATPNDFGVRGAPPSHPELLDWLAGELISNGWRLKPLHRLMLESAAWSQSSTHDPHKAELDRDNRWLWRKAPQRLEAEVIRDSLLVVSGRLDSQLFGPGTLDESSRRRSIYFTVKRSRLMPMLQTFDAPDALSSIGERPTTTVAPQALLLMNNPQTREAARSFAGRVWGTDPADRVRQAYRIALGRSPTEDEQADAREFLMRQTASYRKAGRQTAELDALADYCQVLLCLNDFVYVE